MNFPIQEWFYVTRSSIMARIENTPELNEISKLNNGILYIKIEGSGDALLDGKHVSNTIIGTNCNERYFSLQFTKDVDLPPCNGVLSLEDDDDDEVDSNKEDDEKEIITPLEKKEKKSRIIFRSYHIVILIVIILLLLLLTR
jgi:hypothetical protein